MTHKRHGVVCRGESICYRDAQMGTPCSYSRASPPAAALQWGRGAAARIKFSFSSGPNTAAARVDPRRPDDPVVGNTAHDGGVAIGRQRDGVALSGTSNRVCADQLIGLLDDGNTAIVGGPADNADSGATWVFTRSNGVWTQQSSKLVGTGAVGSAAQGVSVALSDDGDTAIV